MTGLPAPQPLPYVGTDARRRSVPRVLAVFGLLVGGASVAGYGYLLSLLVLQLMANPVQSTAGERQAVAVDTAILAVLIALAGLLLVAAVDGLRGRPSAVRWHRLYAGLQIVASAAFGTALVAEIAQSPASMIAYYGAIPGLAGCVFPVIILIVLGGHGPTGGAAALDFAADERTAARGPHKIFARFGLFAGAVGVLVSGVLLNEGLSTLSRAAGEAAWVNVAARQAAQEQAAADAAAKAAAALPPARPLTAVEADAVVADLGRQSRGPMSAAQAAALVGLLRTPGQPYIDPDLPLHCTNTSTTQQAVQGIDGGVVPNGTLIVRTNHSPRLDRPQVMTRLDIAPDGTVRMASVHSPAGNVTKTPTTTYTRPAYVPRSSLASTRPAAAIDAERRSGRVLAAVSGVNLGLAVWLLVAAVRLLMGTPGRGVRTHAWVKIPAAVATAAVLVWVFNEGGLNGKRWSDPSVAGPALAGLAGAAFPVAALVALPRRSGKKSTV